MKKCIVYSITIYLILTMCIILHKPACIYSNGEFKSVNYFKNKIKYGFNSATELICLPSILVVCSIISFILAKQLE